MILSFVMMGCAIIVLAVCFVAALRCAIVRS
jgi:hypothetical protein